MTWRQAFRKLWWIPVTLAALHIGGFIYDAIHNGMTSTLVSIYIVNFVIAIVIFYFGIATYFVYTLKAAFFILTVIFVIFGFCSITNNTINDTVRKFVEAHINLNYFAAFITVGALLVALVQITQEQQEKYKYKAYFPPSSKSNEPAAILISEKITNDKTKKKKHGHR